MPATDLTTVNRLDPGGFVRLVGPVFEHSPWIAEAAVADRPFGSVDALWSALCEVVRHAPRERQAALIRAHPDLVGRAVLTAESQAEQSAAGLLDLTPEETERFRAYNTEYQGRFGMPFVICARLNKKEAILRAFPVRLQHTPEAEHAAALEEIYQIARLRLQDLVSDDPSTHG
jgi:2-oxo-4-hydroxy-4-carboxy-5-ureidoimidazoline decarboxylase